MTDANWEGDIALEARIASLLADMNSMSGLEPPLTPCPTPLSDPPLRTVRRRNPRLYE